MLSSLGSAGKVALTGARSVVLNRVVVVVVLSGAVGVTLSMTVGAEGATEKRQVTVNSEHFPGSGTANRPTLSTLSQRIALNIKQSSL